jgi:pSer/pThr/pTyr-binding forkhead associated (FHA) protein
MTILQKSPVLSQSQSGCKNKASTIGRLIAVDGNTDIDLRPGLILVGRHPSCDISFESVRISRLHCCIYSYENRVFVRDLNSTNGVRVNGKPITTAEIENNDTLSIAHLRYYCELKSELKNQADNEVKVDSELALMSTPDRSEAEYQALPNERQLDMNEIQKMEGLVKKLMIQNGSENCRVEIHVHWDESAKNHSTTES